jgi:hypothetical protein
VPAYFGGRRITTQAHTHHGQTKLSGEFEFQSDWLGFKRKTRFKVTGVMHEYMHYPRGPAAPWQGPFNKNPEHSRIQNVHSSPENSVSQHPLTALGIGAPLEQHEFNVRDVLLA